MSTFELILTIINTLAIILIPIGAVFVGQNLQDRAQRRKDMQIEMDETLFQTGTSSDTNSEDVFDVDGKSIGEELQRRKEAEKSPEGTSKVDSMLEEAERTGQAYNEAIIQAGNDPYTQNMSWEVREKVTTFSVKPEFQKDIADLRIPRFFRFIPETLFTDGSHVLLDEQQLSENFTLKDKDSSIDFASANEEIREIDVRKDEGGLPKVFKMKTAEQQFFKEYFNNLPPESRVRQCKDMMFKQLNKLNSVDAAELKSYIERIVGNMNRDQITTMEKAPLAYAKKIREKVDHLLAEHCQKTFFDWLQTEQIVCRRFGCQPASIL